MVTFNPSITPNAFYNKETGELTVSKELAARVQSGIQAKLDDLPPAAQEAFLKMTANLAPGDVGTPEKLQQKLDLFEKAARLLDAENSPVAAFIGDITKFLARAMIEFAAEQRESALKDRMAARDAAKADLMQQASQMDKSGDKMQSAAITSLVMGVVAGAISIAAGVVSTVGAGFQLGAAKVGGPGPDGLNKALEAKGMIMNSVGQLAKSFGQVAETSGKGADGIMQSEAKKMEAEGQRDAAKAQHNQQVSDMKKDVQQQMDEMVKQIINFLKEMREAEVDAMRALTKV